MRFRVLLVFWFFLIVGCLGASPIMYELTESLKFGRLDVANGSFSAVSSNSPTIHYLVGSPNGSWLTMSFDGNIQAINPTTGAISVIGATSSTDCSTPDLPTCNNNSQLSFGSAGKSLYGTDFANRLYSINPATGRATLIGNTGIPSVPFIPASVTDGHLNTYDEDPFEVAGSLYANFDAVSPLRRFCAAWGLPALAAETSVELK